MLRIYVQILILQDDTFRQSVSLRFHHRMQTKFLVVIAITRSSRSSNVFLQLHDIAAVYLSSIDSSARNNEDCIL